ncbi:ABC transporter permease [Jeotgalibacillus sp. ET6]|uniref:ABC transporter permease n=1 Tax=Jeotgalibacillus sp. ET6 TaxID=3037260 RepID=UPI0024183D49|nr:ABC transporter permease [Jeotgalibacillus sp. ET6]MDG5471950.1 ABC transporter permease [Jeotgalibacillus sp. ET6]
MNQSIKRTMAIFQKDYKDFTKNLYVSSMIFLPLFLAAFYGRMGVQSLDMVFMVFNLTLTVIAAFTQSALIAEEKEKNTLRGLMLSPAGTGEILIGKSLVSFLISAIVLIFSAFLIGYQPENALLIVAALFVSILFYLGIGTLLGLITRSVMEASVAILPVLLFFSFSSFAVQLSDEYPILKVAEYLPNSQLVDLGYAVQNGAGFGDGWAALLIITAWTIGVSALVVAVYQKKMVDK